MRYRELFRKRETKKSKQGLEMGTTMGDPVIAVIMLYRTLPQSLLLALLW